MKSSRYRTFFYLFLIFTVFFFLINILGGWDIIGSAIRSLISAGIITFLIYVVYKVLLERKGGLKGQLFDKKDSKK
ncbi:hypothetical protein [Athalassotoga saccharophila]|uniref:hypothetical protein n=1 Tax=Athalassotoga saccharophila TaxID=1441386 RepID=UPI001379EE23|nr:hypothetical protein [Athalassotoga saccharophila]BBJ27278.1 hypothetical protein ATHSA_0146 [Athalassotoga saccharophila]